MLCYLLCSLGLASQPSSAAAIPPPGSVPAADTGALMGLGNAAAAASATPHQNYLSALQQHQHQEYVTAAAQRLAELQASAGLVDPLALEGTRPLHPFSSGTPPSLGHQ